MLKKGSDLAVQDVHDVLLVEDDAGDAGLVRYAMNNNSRHSCRLHHVWDGNQALAFLRRQEEHCQAPRPHLILLDLNLPGRTGHEVLESIRADTRLRTIPVVILSTSRAERDVQRAYSLGASSYVSKPMEVEDFTAAIHSIEDFWFGTARIPS